MSNPRICVCGQDMFYKYGVNPFWECMHCGHYENVTDEEREENE